MANETVETSCTEEDDFHENIPPGPSGTLCTVSTPASTNQGKVNPPLPEMPSALTPFFKYMNIANKCHSPKPLKCVNNPVQGVPELRFGAGGSGSASASSWLFDEVLPEMSFLDDTCDLGSPCNSRLCATSNASHPVIVTAVKTPPEKSPEAPPELFSRDVRLSWLDVKNFSEITLLDETHENQSPPAAQMLPNNSNQDVEFNDSTSKLSGPTDPQPGQSAVSQSEESSRLSVQSDKCVEDNPPKTSLVDNPDVTGGSVLESSKSRLEKRGETFDEIQMSSLENTSCSQPANITYNLSCGSMSAQDAQLSTSDMKCNPNTTKTPPSPSTAGAANGTFTLSQPSNGTFTLSQPSNGTITLSHQSNLSLSSVLSGTAPMSPLQNHTIDLPQPDVMNPEMKSDAADHTRSFPTEMPLIKNPMCSAVRESDSSDVPHSSTESRSPQKCSGSPAVEEPVALQNTVECEKLSTQNVSVSLSESSSTDHHQEKMDKHAPQICNLTTSLKEGPPEESGSSGTGSATNPTDEAGKREDICEVDPVLGASPAAARRESEDHSKSGLALFDYSANSINHQSLITETSKAHTFDLDETLDLEGKALVTSTPIVNCKVLSGIPQHEEGRNPAVQKKLLDEDPVKPAAQAAPQALPNLASDHKALLKQQTSVAKPRLPPPKRASELLKNRAASALPGRFQLVTSGPPMTRQRLQAEASRNAAASDAPKRTMGTSGSYNLRATTTGLKLPGSGLPRPQQNGIPSGIQRMASGLKKPSARGIAQAPEKLPEPAVMPSTAAASSAASDAASRARALKPAIKSQKAGTTKSQAQAATPGPKTLQSKKHPLPRNEAVPSSKKPKMDAVSSRNPESSAACQTDGCNDQTCDAAVPSSAAGSSSGCDAATRALKPPAKTQKAVTTKSQAHGCANCTLLEKQNKVMAEENKVMAEEIKRLNEELLKLQTRK